MNRQQLTSRNSTATHRQAVFCSSDRSRRNKSYLNEVRPAAAADHILSPQFDRSRNSIIDKGRLKTQ